MRKRVNIGTLAVEDDETHLIRLRDSEPDPVYDGVGWVSDRGCLAGDHRYCTADGGTAGAGHEGSVSTEYTCRRKTKEG